MLTVVATPIGNLQDISPRGLDALKGADAILCEDTRRTQNLLKSYEIEKPLFSYHKFNEKSSIERLLGEMKNGKRFALVSDAGTPCINDPGQILVDACLNEGIPVTSIPGPSSPILALVLSGFEVSRFQFIGFLPKKPVEALRKALFYRGVTVAFESPERLVKTLEVLLKLDPKRRVAVAREMTKMYEELIRGEVDVVLDHYKKKGPKGEAVIVISEGEPPQVEIETEELVELIQEIEGVTLKEAIKLAAKLKNEPKSEVYKKIHMPND